MKPTPSTIKPTVAEQITRVTPLDPPDDDVLGALGLAPGKKPRATRRTLLTILRLDPRWTGRIRLDRFRDAILVDGDGITDRDLTHIACWLEDVFEVIPSKDLMVECLSAVAAENSYHPVIDWAATLAWDGIERLPSMLTTYFGAPDDELTREMSRAWLVGGAARVRKPGCKLDTVLVLVGEQGVGKSSACKALMPNASFFADTPLDLRSKDCMQNLDGVWLYELAELEGLRGRNPQRVKAFLTSAVDTYRAPYGRLPGAHPRQCFFVATTNEPEFLVDASGARRFWPVPVRRIDVAGLAAARDQLWAEAFARVDRGEDWHLPVRLEKAQRAAAEIYEQTDPLAERLGIWVAGVGRAFTIEEAVGCGLGIAVEKVDKALSMKLGGMLHRLGCTKFRPRQGGKHRPYLWEPAQPRSEVS
jgi:putative DNA primase/helicase